MKKLFHGIGMVWCFHFFWHMKSLLNCETLVIKECSKTWLKFVKLQLKNFKITFSTVVYCVTIFASSIGRDKHSLSPTVLNLAALLWTIFWSSSSNASRLMLVSREVWTRSNTSFLPHICCSFSALIYLQ